MANFKKPIEPPIPAKSSHTITMSKKSGGGSQNQIPLYDILEEAELTNYFTVLRGRLKLQHAEHLRDVREEDLNDIGMSKPEQRRLWKVFNRRCPGSFVGKLKRKVLDRVLSGEDIGHQSKSSDKKNSVNRSASVDPEKRTEQHIIPPHAITLCKQLGEGEFGTVWQGVWAPSSSVEKIQVAVKCVSPAKLQANPLDFIQEAAIMHKITHPNVVRLFGVVLDTKSIMLVNELAPLRSLLECLNEQNLRSSFPVLRLCDYAEQICCGMAYLESSRLIHRDLAARNILVFTTEKIKISDFGLSRALGVGEEYYRSNFTVNLRLPIAWCAPESINFLKFTSASDVWSYGVTLWEMFTYGFRPWPGLTGGQILSTIDSPRSERLEIPDSCPLDFYSLMLQCWEHDPNTRPKFSDIATVLPEICPERVRAIAECDDGIPDHLQYSPGQLITVLNKRPQEYPDGYYWKGVLESGRTGLFLPSNTVAYLGMDCPSLLGGTIGRGMSSTTNNKALSSSSLTGSLSSLRSSFGKSGSSGGRWGMKKSMISAPQGEVRHTGHLGIDGSSFGDLSNISSSTLTTKYTHSALPRQVVAPFQQARSERSATSSPPPVSARSRFLDSADSRSTASTLQIESLESLSVSNNTLIGNGISSREESITPVPSIDNHDTVINFGQQNREEGVGSENQMEHTNTTREEENFFFNDAHVSRTDSIPDLDTPEFDNPFSGTSLLDEVFEALDRGNRSRGHGNGEIPLSPSLSTPPFDTNDRTRLLRSSNGYWVKPFPTKTSSAPKPEAFVRPISFSDRQMLDDMSGMATRISHKTWSREAERKERERQSRETQEEEEVRVALERSKETLPPPPIKDKEKGTKSSFFKDKFTKHLKIKRSPPSSTSDASSDTGGGTDSAASTGHLPRKCFSDQLPPLAPSSLSNGIDLSSWSPAAEDAYKSLIESGRAVTTASLSSSTSNSTTEIRSCVNNTNMTSTPPSSVVKKLRHENILLPPLVISSPKPLPNSQKPTSTSTGGDMSSGNGGTMSMSIPNKHSNLMTSYQVKMTSQDVPSTTAEELENSPNPLRMLRQDAGGIARSFRPTPRVTSGPGGPRKPHLPPTHEKEKYEHLTDAVSGNKPPPVPPKPKPKTLPPHPTQPSLSTSVHAHFPLAPSSLTNNDVTALPLYTLPHRMDNTFPSLSADVDVILSDDVDAMDNPLYGRNLSDSLPSHATGNGTDGSSALAGVSVRDKNYEYRINTKMSASTSTASNSNRKANTANSVPVPQTSSPLDFTIDSVDKYQLLDFVLAALDDSRNKYSGGDGESDTCVAAGGAAVVGVELEDRHRQIIPSTLQETPLNTISDLESTDARDNGSFSNPPSTTSTQQHQLHYADLAFIPSKGSSEPYSEKVVGNLQNGGSRQCDNAEEQVGLNFQISNNLHINNSATGSQMTSPSKNSMKFGENNKSVVSASCSHVDYGRSGSCSSYSSSSKSGGATPEFIGSTALRFVDPHDSDVVDL